MACVFADYPVFIGEEAYDQAGYSVSSAGDVDGDGIGDLLIAASQNDGGGVDAGKAYLILGASLGGSTSIDLSQADYTFVGEDPGDFSGGSVSSAGDVDGDGLSDLLIGASGNDDGGLSAGKLYLVLGASLGGTSTIDLSQADYSFVGENARDNAGRSASSAGDVDEWTVSLTSFVSAYGNDDGGTDVGKTYVILGSSLGGTSTIDLSQADYALIGERRARLLGKWWSRAQAMWTAMASPICSWGRTTAMTAARTRGRPTPILGASSGGASTADSALKRTTPVAGENASDWSGRAVASAGDVDGDAL